MVDEKSTFDTTSTSEFLMGPRGLLKLIPVYPRARLSLPDFAQYCYSGEAACPHSLETGENHGPIHRSYSGPRSSQAR